MRVKEIVGRLTGLNLGPFGASWTPPEPDVARAKRVVAQLEDRRVLYNPTELEVPAHCVASIVDIRRLLTTELETVPDSSPLRQSLRAMRAACRKFLDHIQARGEDVVAYGWQPGHWASWEFNSALGELRGVFGVHLAQIAACYQIDIEPDLASILPSADTPPDRGLHVTAVGTRRAVKRGSRARSGSGRQ